MSMTKMFQCRTQHCVCRDAAGLMEVYNEFIVSMPHAALCVSRHDGGRKGHPSHAVSMPHAALCVSRHKEQIKMYDNHYGFNAARSIVCVETLMYWGMAAAAFAFQCRTQHCVCRDYHQRDAVRRIFAVSMPHAALCVSRHLHTRVLLRGCRVSMPHAALCVSRHDDQIDWKCPLEVSMPHAALCVSRRCVPQPLSRAG